MGYKQIALMIAFLDAGQIVALEILFFVTFILFRRVPELRRYTYATFFLALMGVLGIWTSRYDFIDVANYLQKGDSYVRQSVCVVNATTGTTTSRLLLGEKNVYCTSGEGFKTSFVYDALFPREGDQLVFTYLPLSRRVVAIRSLQGDLLWPKKGKGASLVIFAINAVLVWLFWRAVSPSRSRHR